MCALQEFRAFVDMIARHDTAERDRRLDHSQAVLAVATTARRSAGLLPIEQDPS